MHTLELVDIDSTFLSSGEEIISILLCIEYV